VQSCSVVIHPHFTTSLCFTKFEFDINPGKKSSQTMASRVAIEK